MEATDPLYVSLGRLRSQGDLCFISGFVSPHCSKKGPLCLFFFLFLFYSLFFSMNIILYSLFFSNKFYSNYSFNFYSFSFCFDVGPAKALHLRLHGHPQGRGERHRWLCCALASAVGKSIATRCVLRHCSGVLRWP